MPQSCKICTHADRQAIDAALLANRDGLRIIGAEYGVSKDSLRRHFRAHLEPRQATEPGQDVLPRQVGEPQSATRASVGVRKPPVEASASEPDPSLDRYYAFIDRFRGKRISRAEVATWGYDPEEVQVFVEVALECGDLSRRSEPRQ
jgi:hypothetical protein